MRVCRTALRRAAAPIVAGVVAIVALAVPAGAVAAPSVATASYNLGTTLLPQPQLEGRFVRMPVRLWGAIAAPTAAGPHPVVIIAHGAHGDNCPGEYTEWPCFAREQRNDLGLRYLATALAGAGFVAVVPDLNGAYSGGWGEPAEARRFPQIVNATVASLAAANRGRRSFGVPLKGRVDLSRIGVVGHSRGGLNILRWADGRSAVRSVMLIAPAFAGNVRTLDRPTTVVLGTCDGDTGLTGGRYLNAARTRGRITPAWKVLVTGANHNDYNTTLVRLGNDDSAPTTAAAPGSCEKALRPPAAAQQSWLAQVAVDHFTTTMLGTSPAPWEGATTGTGTTALYGLGVAIARLGPVS